MVEYRVLGPVEAVRDGALVNLGGPQQRRLLAVLLTDPGRVVPLDRLEEALWPSGDARAGSRKAIITYVSRVRSALGGEIATNGMGYRIDPADALDATVFEKIVVAAKAAPATQRLRLYEDALAMWRGAAFGELADEWWARPAAARLEELRLVTAEDRIDTLIELGASERAVSDLDGLVAAFPLRERPVGQLMCALLVSGRQADALRAYQDFRERLADRTGLDPSPALVELERAIARGELPAARTESHIARGYVLGDVVGEGSFATVFRATQPGVGREVAVKVIRPERADDARFVRRFETEAQLVAQLEHPHIVPLYDFWREPGGAYLVFRLMRGGTAEQSLLAEGAWPLERVTRLVDEVGGALSVAHSRGVVHCDVKPANIFFDESGNAHLGDFGIATGTERDATGDHATNSTGSLLYSSPEQLQKQTVTPRSDVYGLGVTMWELLAGVAPFDGGNPDDLVRDKLERPVPSLRRWRTDIGDLADGVLRKATAVCPEDRFANVDDLVVSWRVAAGHERAATTADPAAAVRLPTRPGGVSVANPYKGLRAFGEADARDFFGRRAVIDDLADMVGWSRVTMVIGPSGSGKSSLVSAGLLPVLRERSARVATMTPTEHPLSQLRTALTTIATRPLHSDDSQLITRVVYESDDQVVLFVDQFEELWTMSDNDERRRFAQLVASVADDASIDVRLVFAIRADFFDRPLADPVLGPIVAESVFTVRPMTPPEITAAVRGPAIAAGVSFEADLDAEIVADVIAQSSSLPILQFALAELYGRKRDSEIPARAYREMGGVAGAIAARADSVYDALDATEQREARRLFSRLVTPGAGAEDTRRRARRGELPASANAIADEFVRHRLLVADHDPATREPTLDIAHEALLARWPRLRQWIDEDREQLMLVQHLSQAATDWDLGGRVDTDLYRGPRLQLVDELDEHGNAILAPLEEEFVTASRVAQQAEVAAEARRVARLRRALIVAATGLVLALLAGSIAFVQRNRANGARDNADAAAAAADTARDNADAAAAAADTARDNADAAAAAADIARMTAQSRADATHAPDRAALLAVEAYRRNPSQRAAAAIQSVLAQQPKDLIRQLDVNEVAGQLNFGKTVIAARLREAIVLFRSSDFARIRTIPFGTFLDPLTLSGDERYMAAADSKPGRVTVFSVADGTKQAELSITAGITSLEFDPTDSERLGVGHTDGTADVLRWRSNQSLLTFSGHTRNARLRFAADGRTILTGGQDGVRAWDARTGASLTALLQVQPDVSPPQLGIPTGWAISPSGGLIAAHSVGRVLKVFQVSDGSVAAEITLPCIPIIAPAFLSETDLLVAGCGGVARYNVGTGKLVRNYGGAASATVSGFAFSPSSDKLASATKGKIELWSLTGSALGATRVIPLPSDNATNNGGAQRLTLNADNTKLLLYDSKAAYLYDLTAAVPAPRVVPFAGPGQLSQVRFTDDGRAIVSLRTDALSFTSTVQIWDPSTLTPRRTVAVNNFVDAFALSPDQRYVAVNIAGTSPFDPRVPVLDVEAGSEVHVFDGLDVFSPLKNRPLSASQLSWSPDSTRLLMTNIVSTVVADLRTFEQRRVADVPTAAFNATGDQILAGGDPGFIVYAADSLEPLYRGFEGRTLLRPKFHPSLPLMMTDASCQPLQADDPIFGLELWDATTGEDIGTTGWRLTCGAWYPNGKGFVAFSDRAIEMWDLDYDAWARAACTFAGRNLTETEWERYGPKDTYRETCS